MTISIPYQDLGPAQSGQLNSREACAPRGALHRIYTA